MRIATWNVNSLKARLGKLEEWLSCAEPDVVCLQETKMSDAAFPTMAFTALGYKEIPAIVVEISKEERLLRSLVENMARRLPAPLELINEIQRITLPLDGDPRNGGSHAGGAQREEVRSRLPDREHGRS